MSFVGDDFVQQLSSYYNFLADLYLPRSTLKFPPPGGWPHLTDDLLANLGKDEVVNDLIRHLPCIEKRDNYDYFEIYCETRPVDYSSRRVREALAHHDIVVSGTFDPLPETAIVPSHVLTLAHGPPTGFYIFIDTHRNMAVLFDVCDGPSPNELSRPDILRTDASWHSWDRHATYTMSEFFPMLENMFRRHELVFCNDHEVRFRYDADGREDVCIRALRNHGGFTPAYDKEACLRQIEDEYLAPSDDDATDVLDDPMSTMRLNAGGDTEQQAPNEQ